VKSYEANIMKVFDIYIMVFDINNIEYYLCGIVGMDLVSVDCDFYLYRYDDLEGYEITLYVIDKDEYFNMYRSYGKPLYSKKHNKNSIRYSGYDSFVKQFEKHCYNNGIMFPYFIDKKIDSILR